MRLGSPFGNPGPPEDSSPLSIVSRIESRKNSTALLGGFGPAVSLQMGSVVRRRASQSVD